MCARALIFGCVSCVESCPCVMFVGLESVRYCTVAMAGLHSCCGCVDDTIACARALELLVIRVGTFDEWWADFQDAVPSLPTTTQVSLSLILVSLHPSCGDSSPALLV